MKKKKRRKEGLTTGIDRLFDGQGSVLAFAGEDLSGNQMVAAVVANLWAQMEGKDPGLQTMLMDLDKGRIAATKTSQFILCVYGGVEIPFGMLKSKAIALAQYLQAPLDEVVQSK